MSATIAEQIARQAHSEQVEEWGGHPYVEHLERVVALVGDKEEAQAVAWLHDVLEDTPLTADDLLKAGVDPVVVNAVVLLTRDGKTTYTDYIARIKVSKNVLAIKIKIADLTDHLREETMDVLPLSLYRRYEQAFDQLIFLKNAK